MLDGVGDTDELGEGDALEHTPLTQVLELGQTLPQAPQLLLSVWMFVQVEPQV